MFNSARLKLTGWYLLIIMMVSILFSAIIYQVLMREVVRFEHAQRFKMERRFHQFETPLPESTELIEETRKRIITVLFTINAGVLVISGMLGYVLAGRTLKPIKDMVEEQNRFISDASHEIKTPLTSLKSAFEVYLRSKKPTLQEAKTLITESIGEVNKLQSLSESLLQLAHFQKPNGRPKFETLAVTSILTKAIKKVQPMAKEKHIKIAHTDSDLQLEGNFDSLVDLSVILLDNAVKYSPSKSTISIEEKKSRNCVEVQFVDRGIGISKKDEGHIFDRFYRANTARSKQSGNGYGLGLSIAKKIVDMHNGFIRAESNKKKGSTFTVKLPIRQSLRLRRTSFFS